MKEAGVVLEVKQRIQAFDRCYATKINTNAFGTAGTPDVFACIYPTGQLLVIECKASANDKPTKTQQVQLDKWRRAGAITLVIHPDNLDLVTQVIESARSVAV